MNIFIDTNVYLSFFHLTSDDLEELAKLGVLIQNKQVNLWLPDQVLAELRRNRDARLADALKRFKEQRLKLQLPQICKDFPEYELLRKLQKKFEQTHSTLLEKLTNGATASSLKADVTIAALFGKAGKHKLSDEMLARARVRGERGNPPGKPGSLGDALNWELLLEKVPDGENLFFVTEGSDFQSKLDHSRFNDFLLREWKERKHSDLIFYPRLSHFFKDHFPHIKLATELEKELLIRKLSTSGSFAETHALVAKLSKFSDFTGAQATQIATATTSNNQISWIIDDVDVRNFVGDLLTNFGEHIENDVRERLVARVAEADEVKNLGDNFDDDIPF